MVLQLNNSQPFTIASFIVPETSLWTIFLKADSDSHVYISTIQPYGLLPATEYPKMPFYGFESLVYLFLAIGWSAMAYLRKDNILPVQIYCTAITWTVLAESSINYGYFKFFNNHGYSCKQCLALVSRL